MFYFFERVVELKAWQLYLGNAFWTLFVGIVLMVVAKILGVIGLESEAVASILHRVGVISGARSPDIITGGHAHHPTVQHAHESFQ